MDLASFGLQWDAYTAAYVSGVTRTRIETSSPATSPANEAALQRERRELQARGWSRPGQDQRGGQADGAGLWGPAEALLGEAVQECVQQSLLPGPAALSAREKLIHWLCHHLQSHIPGAELLAFGSYVMGLTTAQGDLDLSLEPGPLPRAQPMPLWWLKQHALALPHHLLPGDTPGSSREHEDEAYSRDRKTTILRTALGALRRLQREGAVEAVVLVSRARVPVLKFVHSRSRVECDISVANRDGVFKSQFLGLLPEMDLRFTMLAYAVKAWAKGEDINDSRNGSLNSLSLLLLCALHLQTRSPPILPPFKDILCPALEAAMQAEGAGRLPSAESWLAQCRVRAEDLRCSWPRQHGENRESLGHLLASFFCQMAAQEQHWSEVCASPYHGQWTSKAFPSSKHDVCMKVEDFLDPECNCAMGVRGAHFSRIKDAFAGAAQDCSLPRLPPSLLGARRLVTALLRVPEPGQGPRHTPAQPTAALVQTRQGVGGGDSLAALLGKRGRTGPGADKGRVIEEPSPLRMRAHAPSPDMRTQGWVPLARFVAGDPGPPARPPGYPAPGPPVFHYTGFAVGASAPPQPALHSSMAVGPGRGMGPQHPVAHTPQHSARQPQHLYAPRADAWWPAERQQGHAPAPGPQGQALLMGLYSTAPAQEPSSTAWAPRPQVRYLPTTQHHLGEYYRGAR